MSYYGNFLMFFKQYSNMSDCIKFLMSSNNEFVRVYKIYDVLQTMNLSECIKFMMSFKQ
jgi:hypothetical protein